MCFPAGVPWAVAGPGAKLLEGSLQALRPPPRPQRARTPITCMRVRVIVCVCASVACRLIGCSGSAGIPGRIPHPPPTHPMTPTTTHHCRGTDTVHRAQGARGLGGQGLSTPHPSILPAQAVAPASCGSVVVVTGNCHDGHGRGPWRGQRVGPTTYMSVTRHDPRSLQR